jgi:hypothetical protein
MISPSHLRPRHSISAALALLLLLSLPSVALAGQGDDGEDELVSRAYHLEHLTHEDGTMLAHQTCLERRGDKDTCRYDVKGPRWFIYNTDAETQEAIAEVLARHDVPARSLTLRLSLFMADHEERELPQVNPSEARALEDLAQLLPYRGYRLVETGWLRAEDRGQIHLGGMPSYVAEFNMTLPVDPDGTNVRMDSFELIHIQPVQGEDGQPAEYDRRVIVRTSFTMEVGETVVVGTSRLDGKDEAMVVLLTAGR